MGKVHNIAAGLMVVGATTLAIQTQNVFSQTPGNKAKTEQVKKSTSQQLLGLDQYDYKKMLYMDISLLSPEVVKKVMFERINEIRKEYNVPALQYNTVLDSVALAFAKEKSWTQRRNDPYCHYDKEGNGAYERMKKSSLRNKIKLIKVGEGQYKWAAENLTTPNGSVFYIMQGLMESPLHRDNVLSPYVNTWAIGYDTTCNILVQDFCNLE